MRNLESRLSRLEAGAGLSKQPARAWLLPCHGPDDLPDRWEPPPGTPPPELPPHIVPLGPLGPVGSKLVFFGDWTDGEREAVVEEARQEYGSCPCSQPPQNLYPGLDHRFLLQVVGSSLTTEDGMRWSPFSRP